MIRYPHSLICKSIAEGGAWNTVVAHRTQCQLCTNELFECVDTYLKYEFILTHRAILKRHLMIRERVVGNVPLVGTGRSHLLAEKVTGATRKGHAVEGITIKV